jgi:hypothetical protein
VQALRDFLGGSCQTPCLFRPDQLGRRPLGVDHPALGGLAVFQGGRRQLTTTSIVARCSWPSWPLAQVGFPWIICLGIACSAGTAGDGAIRVLPCDGQTTRLRSAPRRTAGARDRCRRRARRRYRQGFGRGRGALGQAQGLVEVALCGVRVAALGVEPCGAFIAEP